MMKQISLKNPTDLRYTPLTMSNWVLASFNFTSDGLT